MKYYAVSRSAVEHALNLFPSLCRSGMRFARPACREKFGIWDSEEKLLEVAASLEWLDEVETRKSINPNHSSYGYKHMVEEWWRLRGRSIYVANGSFIVAALFREIPYKLADHLNVAFGISEQSLRRMSKKAKAISSELA